MEPDGSGFGPDLFSELKLGFGSNYLSEPKLSFNFDHVLVRTSEESDIHLHLYLPGCPTPKSILNLDTSLDRWSVHLDLILSGSTMLYLDHIQILNEAREKLLGPSPFK